MSSGFKKAEKAEDNEQVESPSGIKKLITRVACKLGGYDKVGKLTYSQAEAIMEDINEDWKLIIKLHGGKMKEDKASEAKEATVDDINMLMGIFG